MLNNPTPKSEQTAPVIFFYPVGEVIKLDRPDDLPDIRLLEVIEQRRSGRNFQKRTLVEIGNLLWLSAKVKNISVLENGYVLSQRPSASAGARHPIDIILCTPDLKNGRVLYYYNAFEHALQELTVDKMQVDGFLSHINEAIEIRNATILWFVAHPDRTSVKYEDALSLVWRDSGALLHCVQIACTVLGMESCPVGSLGEPFISKMFEPYGITFGAGGIVIG